MSTVLLAQAFVGQKSLGVRLLIRALLVGVCPGRGLLRIEFGVDQLPADNNAKNATGTGRGQYTWIQ